MGEFLRYQLTTNKLADTGLHAQLRSLLSLEEARSTPFLKGPYISLSRGFRDGPAVSELVGRGHLHPLLQQLASHPTVYGCQLTRLLRQRGTANQQLSAAF